MKKALLAVLLTALLLLMAGCGPKDDKTDDLLSSYGVDVDLPFATQRPDTLPVATAKVSEVRGWNGEIVSLTDGEYTTLSLGNIGTRVKNMQKRLIELGYLSGTASGTFDQATVLGVKRFQAAYGQNQTGMADELMQHYLFDEAVRQYNASSATVAPTTASYRKLQRGDSGSDVISLQARLFELGYMSTTTGTYFDSYTETAIKDFESAYGKSRTGVATVALQEVLFSSSAKRADEAIMATATPAPGGYTDLSAGSKGTAVKNLQNRLRELGYMTAKADGVYGEKTAEAVRAFEAAYGKGETGIATAAMQAFLFSEDAASKPEDSFSEDVAFGYSTLSYGSYGDAVIDLQKRLKDLGYLNDTVDGYYGKATAAAVSAFESYHGYTQTGVATAALQEYLFSGSAQSYNGKQVTSSYTRLAEGSYGNDVMALQSRLAELGYFTDTVTGYFEDSTAKAVMDFESAYGKSRTGIATSALQSELYSSSARTNPNRSVEDTYQELKNGSKGDDVAKLQSRLIELGYLAGTVDGVYGSGTEEAIKGFEAAYKRTQTGIATAALQSVLYSDSALRNTAGTVAVSYSTIEYGDSGETVVRLQNRLKALGYLKSDVNGQFDYATVEAVRAYQGAAGHVQTGRATSELQKEIFSANAKPAHSASFVTVNKSAMVKSTRADVYADMYSDSPMGSVSAGTGLKVLRTSGEWAEVQSSNGSIGYMALSDLEYIEEVDNSKIVNVNALAYVCVDKADVYEKAATSSKKLGTLTRDTFVTLLRTRGEWAEIENSSGNVGYCYVWQVAEYAEKKTEDAYYTPLTPGNTGNEVKRLQRRLAELGYFDGDIGGNYLTKTTYAVTLVQRRLGLPEDGCATVGLQDVLFSKLAPKYADRAANKEPYSDMYAGRSDDEVGTLQLDLIQLGFLSANDVNFGTYDDVTRQAVKAVQEKAAMRADDGIATAELIAALRLYSNEN